MPFKAIVTASSLCIGETIGPVCVRTMLGVISHFLCYSWGQEGEKRGHDALLGLLSLELTNHSHGVRRSWERSLALQPGVLCNGGRGHLLGRVPTLSPSLTSFQRLPTS